MFILIIGGAHTIIFDDQQQNLFFVQLIHFILEKAQCLMINISINNLSSLLTLIFGLQYLMINNSIQLLYNVQVKIKIYN